MLGGGLLPGTLAVVYGATGIGKTHLGLTFADHGRVAETLGMEICLPVWKHRGFIDAHRYDHARITTLLLVTTEETRLEDLLARKVATGDVGATANTIVVLGSERVGNRVARMLCVVKHRGSAMSDEIVEYRIGARGIELG